MNDLQTPFIPMQNFTQIWWIRLKRPHTTNSFM